MAGRFGMDIVLTEDLLHKISQSFFLVDMDIPFSKLILFSPFIKTF